MEEIGKVVYLGNSLRQWTSALSVLIISIALITIAKKVIINRLKNWSKKTETQIDDFILAIIEKLIFPLLVLLALYFSANILTFVKGVSTIIRVGFLITCTYLILRIITKIIQVGVFTFIKKQDNGEIKEKQSKGLLLIANIIVWVLGVVFLIDNLGYDVTALVAGLGIGGIAIALAAQAILGDLFSYFVIFFDRPFEIGDFIIVNDKMGTVEYVGIKTTRIRTLSGEQLICSNTYLTNSRVHNFKRMEQRRVVFKIGVVYMTSCQQLRRIPNLVEGIITSKENIRFDRGHFSEFGDFSLNFEFVYYVLSSDYNQYMDRQQEINLDIAALFQKEKIEFAYPTQTVLMKNS